MPNSNPSSYGSINSEGCPFPGSSGNTAFTDYTTPSARSWNSNNTTKPVTDIQEKDKLISFSFMKSGATVSNVRTSVSSQSVTVSWDLPSGVQPDGYAIYRDNRSLITLMDGSVKSYTQNGVSKGTYTYCVAPIYGVSESTKQCAIAIVSGETIDCPPVELLSAKVKGNSVVLNWSYDHSDAWISRCGDLASYVSYNLSSYTIATRFSVDDLKYIYGQKLTKVCFGVYDLSCKYTVKVWTPNQNSSNPDNPVLTQSVNPTATGIYEVVLNTPVNLNDPTKDLWIGIAFEQTSTPTYVAGVDGGPRKPNVNYLYYNNRWWMTNERDNMNFYIKGYVEMSSSGNSSMENIVQLDVDPLKSEATEENNIPEIEFATEKAVFLESAFTDNLKSIQAESSFLGYKVYRDNQYLKTVRTKSYTDGNVPEGNHVYCVSAVYGSCESEQACVSAISTIPPNPYFSINQLAASVIESTVKLTWEKPNEKGGTISYCSDAYGGGIGSSTSALNFDIAIRFTAGDLAAQNRTKLTKVRFMPGSVSSSYSIRVWQGGNSAAPEVLLIDQPVKANVAKAWQEVTLNTPLVLDIYEELWIGVHCSSPVGEYPAAYDRSLAVSGKGNMMYFSGEWLPATSVNANFTNNWCITGLLEPMESLSSYRVYRDGQLLGHTTTSEFTQSMVPHGTYVYEVSAVYEGDNESDKQRIDVSVIYAGIDQVLSDNLINVFPNPISRGGLMTIDLGIENVPAEILFYNITGKLVKKESVGNKVSQCNIDLSPGTYLMQVRLKNGKINTLKIVVN
jgi:hypothetical protein